MVVNQAGNLLGEKQSVTKKVEGFLFVAYKSVSKTVLREVFQDCFEQWLYESLQHPKPLSLEGMRFTWMWGVLPCSLQDLKPHYFIAILSKQSSTRA